MKTAGNTVVITGGSSGIGLAVAKKLLGLQNTVIAIGRSPERLAKAKSEAAGLHTIPCDITDESAVVRAFSQIATEFASFNLLLNAAGTTRPYRFAQDPNTIAIAREEINTNLLGTVIASRVALPLLLKQSEAALMILSSGVAYAPHLDEPTHSATKAALHALSHCLRYQLKGSPVKVFEILPPMTDTPLTRNIEGKKISADAVADAVINGLAHNNYEIRVAQVKALTFLARLSPGLAERIVTGSAKEKR